MSQYTDRLCAICGHEESCHEDGHCHWRRQGATLACHCTKFVKKITEQEKAVAKLPLEDRLFVAVANFCLINQIIREGSAQLKATATDDGINISIFVPVSNSEKWINEHLPKSRESAEKALELLARKPKPE